MGISEVTTLRLFAFYRDNAVVATRSSDPTEQFSLSLTPLSFKNGI